MFNLVPRAKTPAKAMLAALAAGAGKVEVCHVVGRAGRNVFREHFEQLGRERHRPHVRHNFWDRAAKKTQYQIAVGGAKVVVNQEGVAQRRFGGDIKPRKPGITHLAIPLPDAPEAHGRVPGEFGNLLERVVNKTTNRGVLKKKGKGGKALFALVPELTLKPDPSVLPKPTIVHARITEAVTELMHAYAEGANG